MSDKKNNEDNQEKIYTCLCENILRKGHQSKQVDRHIFYGRNSTLIDRIKNHYGVLSEVPKNDNYKMYHIIVSIPNLGRTFIQGYKTI